MAEGNINIPYIRQLENLEFSANGVHQFTGKKKVVWAQTTAFNYAIIVCNSNPNGTSFILFDTTSGQWIRVGNVTKEVEWYEIP